jgi:hypothetical protein
MRQRAARTIVQSFGLRSDTIARMTHEEAIKWLRARGGSVTTKALVDGGHSVIASANGLASSVAAKDLTDQVDVRHRELEAIEELKKILES